MIPRTVSRLTDTLTHRGLRRSLARQISIKTNQNEDYQENRKTNHFSLAAGALLGASVVLNFLTDEDQIKKEQSLLSRLAAIKPVVKAAEPTDNSNSPPKSRRKTFNFIADLVEETAPSLVYIEIKEGRGFSGVGGSDWYTGDPLTLSNGSGFIVSSDGLILTNAHVVINKPKSSIQVKLQDGRTFPGLVEDVDVKSDLATLRIDCRELPELKLGCSRDTRPGEWVIALGSPLALSNTITTGVISNIARPHQELGLRTRDIPEYIQTDAAITFGNSGGPLINLDGEAIGINSMKVTAGISFAIPIDYAKEFLRKSAEAQKKGGGGRQKTRRYLGISMMTLDSKIIDGIGKHFNSRMKITHGILIYKVVEGSPAFTAGLRPGDIVTHINDSPIHGVTDLYKLLEGQQDLAMTVLGHKGNIVTRTIRPERP